MKKLFLIVTIAFSINLYADDIASTIVSSEFGANNGSITLIINAGVSPFIFSWTGPDGFTSLDQNISDLAPGEYCVAVNDFYCGVAELCVTVEELPFVGIQNSAVGSMSVFPNPFSNGLDIQITMNQAGDYSITLSDQSGKLLIETKEVLLSGENMLHFNTDNLLTAGIYNLIIKSEDNVILMRTVVKIE